MIEFKRIKDLLPPIGTPLIVRTFNKVENKHEIKYPVYYVKEPYENKYAWYFFPACEGICKLLPEYSEVMEWATLIEGGILMKEICGNYKYNKRIYDGHCNAEFCCDNEESDYYAVPTAYDDACDDWEENQ